MMSILDDTLAWLVPVGRTPKAAYYYEALLSNARKDGEGRWRTVSIGLESLHQEELDYGEQPVLALTLMFKNCQHCLANG